MKRSIVLVVLLAAGAARAQHTAADARRTSAKLDRLLRHADADARGTRPTRRAKPAAAPTRTATAANRATKAARAGASQPAPPTPIQSAAAAAGPVAAPARAAAPARRPRRAARTGGAASADDIPDAVGDVIGDSLRIAFDPEEQAERLQDLPKTPAEVDAHLRRLDRALRAHPKPR